MCKVIFVFAAKWGNIDFNMKLLYFFSMKKLFKIILFCSLTMTVYLGTLYFAQNNLLFFPDKKYKSPADVAISGFSEMTLKASDGVNITAWYHQGNKDKPAILFLHGNAGQVATFAPSLLPIADAGYAVLMMEYRGFGKTQGKISQKTVVQDAALAFDWLKDKGYSKIVISGYSFGTAFSCALTEVRSADGLILTAPFSSLVKIVSEKPVPLARWVLKDNYMSVDYLKKYKAPLLIVHGKEDKLIPYHHAQILFNNAASQEKQIKLLEDETHTSIFFEKKNVPYILEFLKSF